MPGVAARVMAWQRRMGGAPGPLGASGEAGSDQPVQVEMQLGGTWVDITATSSVLVRDDGGNINISSKGIRDEGSTTEQANATLQLRNTDGRFSPRNPAGIYYGLIGRNTPVRISVPDGLGGKSYRMQGEASDWKPDADSTGNDVWCDLTTGGILRRLAQGPPPERSVIFNAVMNPAPTGLVAYWPCEDPAGSIGLASGTPTGSAMSWTGIPALATYAGATASDPLPDLTSASISGSIPAYNDPTATQVRFLAYIPKSGLSDGKIVCAIDQVDYSPGSPQLFELYYSTTDAPNSLVLRACAADGTVLGTWLPHTLDVRGKLIYVSIELQEVGANISRVLRIVDVLTGRTVSVADTEFVTQLTRVTRVSVGVAARAVSGPASTANLPGVSVGHITVETAITAIDALGTRLNPIGETAGRRIQRLCGEAGLPFEWVGDLDDTVPMGAQTKQNMISLVQECVLADGGLLYESTSTLGLGYRTRTSLYNQDPTLVLDYTSGQLAQVPTPVDDDQRTQNQVTVSVGGVTATYAETSGRLGTAPPPAGVGVYGANTTSPLDLNLAASDQATLLDQASWRVHLGTVDEARFPQISVNHLGYPSISPAMRRAILGMRIGDRIQISNPPSWMPPDTIDQLVIGMSETITHFAHSVTFVCQPASPYSTIGYLDTTARIDTDGSQLLTAIGPADTSFDVVPTSDMSMLWTTDPTDMPVDIRSSGEIMRVTSISPKLSDTFTRSVSSGWGTTDTGQAWTTVGGAAAEYSVSGSQALVSLTSTNISRYVVTPAPSADVDLRVEASSSVLATGGPHYVHLVARYLDANNNYMARIAFNTDQTLSLTIQKRVAGVQTDIANLVVPGTHAANTFFGLRFQVQGSMLRARAWPLTGAEPGVWQATAIDGALTDAGQVGTRSILSSINTNTLPVSVAYDNLRLVNVQTFNNVTRSVNGVVKSHPAGDDVRLAYPTYLAL
ncbi:hypothetical protein [Streptomyces sp. NPDC004324]